MDASAGADSETEASEVSGADASTGNGAAASGGEASAPLVSMTEKGAPEQAVRKMKARYFKWSPLEFQELPLRA